MTWAFRAFNDCAAWRADLERAILYVDGFNFYYGVTNHWRAKKGLPGLGWCNFRALVERHFPL